MGQRKPKFWHISPSAFFVLPNKVNVYNKFLQFICYSVLISINFYSFVSKKALLRFLVTKPCHTASNCASFFQVNIYISKYLMKFFTWSLLKIWFKIVKHIGKKCRSIRLRKKLFFSDVSTKEHFVFE